MNRTLCVSCAVLVLALVALPAMAKEETTTAATPQQAMQQEAFTIGVQAYIWAYPLEESYRTMRLMTDVAKPEGVNAPVNQFGHARELLTPTTREVVRPNNDTLYSIAWLDLSEQPIVLHVPDTHGRYYVFELLDAYTNVIQNIGRRTVGSKGGDYAITGPGWNGKLPTGVLRVQSSTPIVWVIGRTLVDGPADLPNVIALQDQYGLTPLDAFGKTASATATSSETTEITEPGGVFKETPEGLKFFELVGTALQKNHPFRGEEGLLALFERIGLSVEQGFQPDMLDPAARAGLEQAIPVARQLIAAKAANLGVRENGWLVNFNTGRYGYDYLLRAAVAHFGLGANVPEESLYPSTIVDGQDRPLSGQFKYTLRFEQTPPVDAFWSVTMYDAKSQMLVENPIQRYSIGDRTKGLEFGEDGSLTLYIQHESPGPEKESNWLPAPADAFTLTLRAYNPKPELLEGEYEIPPVERTE